MADRTPTTPADQSFGGPAGAGIAGSVSARVVASAQLIAAGLLDRPLRCVVVTPEATILDREVEFVALPLYDGEIGIGRGHSPLIGRLGYGEMRLRNATGQSERYYVDGGFVQVVGNVVSILTANAVLATAIDSSVAAERLRAAHAQVANSDVLFEQRDRLEAQARAQLRMVRHS